MNHDVIAAFKTIFSAFGGVMLGVALPVIPYASVCTLMVIGETATAWRLGRRAAAMKGRRRAQGVVRSARLGVMLSTLCRVYALLLMARAVQTVILDPDWHMDLVRVVAAAVCLWQALSMLENEASCCGSRWARIARRWLIDNTERRAGISLDELREDAGSERAGECETRSAADGGRQER